MTILNPPTKYHSPCFINKLPILGLLDHCKALRKAIAYQLVIKETLVISRRNQFDYLNLFSLFYSFVIPFPLFIRFYYIFLTEEKKGILLYLRKTLENWSFTSNFSFSSILFCFYLKFFTSVIMRKFTINSQ